MQHEYEVIEGDVLVIDGRKCLIGTQHDICLYILRFMRRGW